MSEVQIVTDSAALFVDAAHAERYGIRRASFRYARGGDFRAEVQDFAAEPLFGPEAQPPLSVVPPSVDDWVHLFETVTDPRQPVLCLPSSSRLNASFANAVNARNHVPGRSQVHVVETAHIGVGQGMLVLAAAQAASLGQGIDEIMRALHGLREQVYSMFFVPSMDPLLAMGHVSRSQQLLGTMLEIKPLLTIEDGQIVPIEKVFERQTAFDKMAEFSSEFEEISDIAVTYGQPALREDVRLLRERLAIEFPRRAIPAVAYGPSLAQYIGDDALGITVFDREPF